VEQTPSFNLEISAVLKDFRRPEILSWLENISGLSALSGALLRVTHPELFEMGIRCYKIIKNSPNEFVKPEEIHDLIALLDHWCTPFHSYSTIVNRQSPAHRDSKSRVPWQDILFSVGRYSGAVMKFPGLGLSFKYETGTGLIFSRRLIQHEVTPHAGDRVCVAHYFRYRVQEKLCVEAAGWPVISYGVQCNLK
jgi:hypothetical protein